MNQTSEAPPRLFYGYIIAVAGLIIMTSMFSTRFVFGVFFKPVLTDFGWTRAMTSFAFSLSMFMEGLIGIAMGGLNDRFGPRIVLSICGALVGLGCLLMSQITAIWQLYLFFGIIMGSGMSGVWVPLTGMVARWFVLKRGIMTGFVLTGAGLGALIAPPLANWLISVYDWRNAFSIMGIPVLVLVILAAQFLRGDPSQMGLMPYGSETGGNPELKSQSNEEGFHLREAVLVRQFWLVMFMLFCFGFCSFLVIVHIVPHATDIRFSAVDAARVLAAIGGITIIGRLFLGNLADKTGSRGVFIIGFIAMTASFFWLVPARELWMLYVFAMVFGFVQGGMGSSESLLVADIFGLRSHGLIYGIIACGFTLGATVGPWLAGYLFDITGSYQSSFVTCAVIGIIGLILTVLIKPITISDQL
ncbi:MFS transporter [Thermodesulfobacteriota bacterium]